MDPDIWCRLPDDLIQQHVLPWLPLQSLIQATAVCKTWKSLILGRSFAHKRAMIDSPLTLVVNLHQGMSPSDFGFPLPKQQGFMVRQKSDVYRGILACSGGLMCLASSTLKGEHRRMQDLLVTLYNPINKSYVELPTLTELPAPIDSHQKYISPRAGMIVDAATKVYKVVLICWQDQYSGAMTYMYDSTLACWQNIMSIYFPLPYIESVAVDRGIVFGISIRPCRRIFLLDLKIRNWRELILPSVSWRGDSWFWGPEIGAEWLFSSGWLESLTHAEGAQNTVNYCVRRPSEIKTKTWALSDIDLNKWIWQESMGNLDGTCCPFKSSPKIFLQPRLDMWL
ncbi:hypothetical protein O6H91_03G126300 [Diphasiastrum complanatum]|nr:hypothetical protein O6H91_03G126300 [Diphasiastrum complanatum]